MEEKKEKKTLYKFLIFLTKFFALRSKTYGLKLLLTLLEKGNIILAGNHNSILDPLVVTATLYKFILKKLLPKDKKLYWIGNVNLPKRRFLGLRYLFFLKQDTGYLAATRKVIHQSVCLLKQGNIIGIFPEGLEHNEEKLRKGKAGTALIALFSGASVVPVACQCPKTSSRFRGFLGLFLQKKITFGNPIIFPKIENSFIKANPKIIESATKKIMYEISQLCGKPYEF